MTFTSPDQRLSTVTRPPAGETWVALSREPLPVSEAVSWVVRPDCGGSVLFSGSTRDHAPGRPDVYMLEYEAYETYAGPVFADIATRARERWSERGHELGRIVIWHRTGPVPLGESAVVVAVSAPHRPEAFEAARFCIDTVKETAPIWKRELWPGGGGWGTADGA